MSEDTALFDCVIAGGGMIGLAAAKGLCDLGLTVALIEKNKPPLRWAKDSLALRVSAINMESQSLLTRLKVWDEIKTQGADFTHMFVWDENSTGEIAFDASSANLKQLGSLVPNRSIVRALYKAIKDKVTLFCPDTLDKFEYQNDTWNLSLNSGKKLKCKLLIGADGARSRIRKTAGIKTDPVFYNQHGLVANIKTEKPHQNTAWQRFLNTGPLAFLPLQDAHMSSIVWTCPPDVAKDLNDCTEAEFNQRLTQAFDGKLGECTLVGERANFPLYHHHASSYSVPGLMLLGDAAHSIHPLAGLGANLGFNDVKCLLDAILEAQTKNRPVFTPSVLKLAERNARCKNELTLRMMTTLNALFSNQNTWLKSIRGIGLNFINRQNILKQFFMKMAGEKA